MTTSLTPQQIEEIIKEATYEVLGDDMKDFSESSLLKEDLGMDSIDMFDILALLSKKIENDFNSEDFFEVQTVSDFKKKLIEILEEEKNLNEASNTNK